MRLSTEPGRDDLRAEATIVAALDAEITIFDTARAYALGDDDLGHNERLLAKVIAGQGASARVRIVTKGGMRRPGGRWEPDGRAKSIVADCEASLAALDGLAIDLYLLHAPDPATPFATSVRALAQLLERGLVRRVGLSNVTAAQLDVALGLAPISAVEMSLGWLDDTSLRSGLVARCLERGVTALAHRPLGGVKRRRGIARDEDLRAVGARHGASPAAIALAALLDLHPAIVALPGATRPETARDSAAAAALVLDDDDRVRLTRRLDRRFASAPRAPATLDDEGEVVMLMGLQGSGKTDAVASWVGQGHERLSRDERGGTMKMLHRHLDERLAAGARRVVLDNTYVARATRREAIEVAWKHRLRVRGVWFDTPLPQAQVNVVLRMVRHHGRLLEPAEMAAIGGPTALPPHAQHRLLRGLELPALDEGYAALDVTPFVRRVSPELRPGRVVALDALVDASGRLREGFASAIGDDPETPRLVFAWRPDRSAPIEAVAPRIRNAAPGLPILFAECVHPAGPAICWCRPPLPGLPIAFAVAQRVDLSRSTLIGTNAAHRSMAEALGAAFHDP